VTLTSLSSLRDVVSVVGHVLFEGGIRAVLSGGACASIHSRGLYQSADVDLIIVSDATRSRLDELMASIEFRRRGDRYVHPRTRFYVEFPRGPLAIGTDVKVKPEEITVAGKVVLALSPTDSCRDRLAAFYHWRDRQSLRVAVLIALANSLDYRVVREWSSREGFEDDYRAFLAEVELARARRARRRATRS